MKRIQWSAAVLAFLLFGVGAVAGALAHRYYANSVGTSKPASEDFRGHYVSDMKARLKLTPKQVDQLEDILDETKLKFRAAHEPCRPAIGEVKQEQISQVKAILTSGQVPLYDQLLAERESHAKEQEASEHLAEEKEAAARKARLH